MSLGGQELVDSRQRFPNPEIGVPNSLFRCKIELLC